MPVSAPLRRFTVRFVQSNTQPLASLSRALLYCTTYPRFQRSSLYERTKARLCNFHTGLAGNMGSLSAFSGLPKTNLIFQTDSTLYSSSTNILKFVPFTELPEVDQALLKGQIEGVEHVAITSSTIFHPQGGGQPSDEGSITTSSKHVFNVITVRHSASDPSIVLHFGSFKDMDNALLQGRSLPLKATQDINAEKRHLYSRLHTAGHVLGAATRHLLQDKIENFDELKASHFPDSAACEFRGLIPGDQKAPIQAAVDGLLKQDLPVEIAFWSKKDFADHDLMRLVPENWDDIAVKVDRTGNEDESEDTRIRIVNIVGAEVYPCGGTHVETTKKCGKVVVRKISRQKGESRVSYKVE